MRLEIRHFTTYRYSRPVPYAIQTLRLTPRIYEGTQVIRWQVRGERNCALSSYVDGMGNVVHTNTIALSHETATIAAAGVVETHATGGLVRDEREPLPPAFFLRTTPLTAADEAIVAFATETMKDGARLDNLRRLMEAVGERIAYRPGATHAHTSASEALALGAGVCQDHAHLFIAACRFLGIPARYVGGYFWTGETGDASRQASHAWAEAFVDELGWVGFDPTNVTLPDERHVRVGIGLDYWSAAPIRGIRRGEAAERLSVAVDIAAAETAQ